MKNIRLRLALLLTIVCCSLSSCSKGDNIEPIILNNEYLEFETQRCAQSITVNVVDWISWVKSSEKASGISKLQQMG